jgi:Holliday junction resolvasome RuvABC endonuclease subunit
MSKEIPKILAINPGSRYVGWAVMHGPDLIDWGVKVIRAKTPRRRLTIFTAILVQTLERFHPDVLAIKQIHPSRSSPCLDNVTKAVTTLARRQKLKVYEYSIGQLKRALCSEGKANKRQLAEHMATMYPALAHDLRSEKANKNPYYIKAFEAVALGVVTYQRTEGQNTN